MMRLLAPRHDHPAYSDRVVTRLTTWREADHSRDQQHGGNRNNPFHSVNRQADTLRNMARTGNGGKKT